MEINKINPDNMKEPASLPRNNKKVTRLEKNALTSVEVCNIIKTGAELGLSKLKFGDLELEFGMPAKSQPSLENHEATVTSPAPPAADAAMSEDQRKSLAKDQSDLLEQEEMRFRDEQVMQMMIEDPIQAEKLIMDGDFDEDDNADGDDESVE